MDSSNRFSFRKQCARFTTHGSQRSNFCELNREANATTSCSSDLTVACCGDGLVLMLVLDPPPVASHSASLKNCSASKYSFRLYAETPNSFWTKASVGFNSAAFSKKLRAKEALFEPRLYSIPAHKTGTCIPGNNLEAVRYAATAWSDSSCMAKAWPNAIHAGANAWSATVDFPKYRLASSNRFATR